MSLLRPQFTVRRLMAVVVLVAMGFPLIQICQLRERYKREAKRHDQDQLYWTKTMNDSLRVLTTYKSGEIPDKQSLIAGNLAQIERLRKQAEYSAPGIPCRQTRPNRESGKSCSVSIR
jgi:hypothetical protein